MTNTVLSINLYPDVIILSEIFEEILKGSTLEKHAPIELLKAPEPVNRRLVVAEFGFICKPISFFLSVLSIKFKKFFTH